MPRKARRITHARDPQVEAQLDELVRAQNEHVESPTDVHGVGLFRVAKTSREDQWPDWGDVQGKPEAFPPVPHAATHAAGASDPVTPASIGAETPQGAQEKADLAEAHAKAYTDAHAADATLHVTAAYRAAMDNAKAPPSATNPFVTEETLNDAMTGSAKPGVETLADLAAIPPEQRADKDTRLVEEDGRIYRFDAEATEGDVKPNVGSGYWIAVAAATQNHNNLAGLQGGSAEERYHLTRSEHDMVLAHPSQNTGVHGVGTAYVAKTSRADQWPDWGDIRNKPSTYTPASHASTHASGGADPITPASIGAETPSGAQAKADAARAAAEATAQAALSTHKSASPLDHPDGSVTDAKIGNRTVDQSQAPTGSTGTLTQLLSWIANRIKAITGAANWYDAPATTLAAAAAHIAAAAPHSGHETPTGAQAKVDSHSAAVTGVHGVGTARVAKTSRADQWPDWNDVQGKPTTFPPAPHASSHASGGSDPISPASIGAETPSGAQAKVDAHAQLTSAHGATSSATANRLVIRDSAGRAKFAQAAADGDAVVYPVPVTALKRAQGSSGAQNFNVHQYALASPTRAGNTSSTGFVGIGYSPAGTGTYRQWSQVFTGGYLTLVTWDYLAASGRPRIWAVVDDAGRIVTMWEAEDPVDLEEPDACPIGLVDADGNSIIPTGGAVVRLLAPKPEHLTVVMDRLQRAPLPSRYPWHLTASTPPTDAVPKLHRGLFRKALRERGLEEPPDIRDVYSIRNPHRRDWYLQLWLRNASRVLHDHKAHTLIPLYLDMFRVDKATGALELA